MSRHETPLNSIFSAAGFFDLSHFWAHCPSCLQMWHGCDSVGLTGTPSVFTPETTPLMASSTRRGRTLWSWWRQTSRDDRGCSILWSGTTTPRHSGQSCYLSRRLSQCLLQLVRMLAECSGFAHIRWFCNCTGSPWPAIGMATQSTLAN